MADSLDLDTIQGILAAELQAADDYGDSDLSQQRSKAMDYYLGDMDADMPQPEGRSGAVSTDVADVVEDLMPQIMEVFAAGDTVVEFDPVGPEDEEAARQETDYVNHVFWNDNPGFRVLYDFAKDALLQKNGLVKVWWDEKAKAERETYAGDEAVSDDLFALLVADPDVEIIEHTQVQRPGPGGVPELAHEVVLERRRTVGRCAVMAVPPEEFVISRRARSIEDTPYCAHKVRRTESDLLAEGYDAELIRSLPSWHERDDDEEDARQTIDDWDARDTDSKNRPMREIQVVEHYIHLDIDGSGIAQLRKVMTDAKGKKVLTKGGVPDIEPFDVIPFADMTPVPMQHQFWGRSVAELVMDIQRIKTALVRSGLDNVYFLNNQRMEVAEDHASDTTLDDLLTNRPGGIVRTKRPGGLIPIQNQPILQHIAPVIEYWDQQRTARTGALQNGAVIPADVMNNSTATAANYIANTQQARVRLICRIFAETGIKRMFLLMHRFVLRHDRRGKVVRMRGKWVAVDPRQWKTRTDMTASVGLGTGTKDQQLGHVREILGLQLKALEMQGSPQGPMVNLGNVYATLKRLVELAGLKSAELYFSEPTPEAMAQMAQQPPKPDPKMLEAQAKAQLEQHKAMAAIELDRMKLEAEMQLARERMAAEIQLKREEMQLRAMVAPVAAPSPSQVRMGGEVG